MKPKYQARKNTVAGTTKRRRLATSARNWGKDSMRTQSTARLRSSMRLPPLCDWNRLTRERGDSGPAIRHGLRPSPAGIAGGLTVGEPRASRVAAALLALALSVLV